MIDYDYEFLGTGFIKNAKVQYYIVNMIIQALAELGETWFNMA